MRSLIVASSVALFSLGCGAELTSAEEASSGQELRAQATCEGWIPELPQWCLTTCTNDPSKLWVVGSETEVGGFGKCNDAAEKFCVRNMLGHRKNACWGWYR